MEIREFKHVPRGTLIGFAKVKLENGMVISDITLHKKDGARWAGMPGRPMIDSGRNLIIGDDGKIRYQPVIEIPDRERRDAFSRQVWDAFERYGLQAGRVA